ncbi:hypothetical protein Tco_1322008, partial [Tanacetum coccineum]
LVACLVDLLTRSEGLGFLSCGIDEMDETESLLFVSGRIGVFGITACGSGELRFGEFSLRNSSPKVEKTEVGNEGSALVESLKGKILPLKTTSLLLKTSSVSRL